MDTKQAQNGYIVHPARQFAVAFVLPHTKTRNLLLAKHLHGKETYCAKDTQDQQNDESHKDRVLLLVVPQALGTLRRILDT